MKYHIIVSGKIKEPYLAAGISEFLKRLTPYGQVKITETAEERMPENPSAAQKRQVLEKEGTRLLKYVHEGSYLFVLDVAGDIVSSEELAETLAALSLRGYSEFSFIIGGPFGLSEAVRKRADTCSSFGRITLTHQMIRMVLLEQLYRAVKIQRHEPYHL